MSRLPLDPVIHAPNRLEICAFLGPLEEAEFRVLRDELQVSDSVLSKQLCQLEAAGYVRLRKAGLDGRRRTWVSLTAGGRRALSAYVRTLQALVTRVDTTPRRRPSRDRSRGDH